MRHTQPDLFAEDNSARQELPESERIVLQARLEATLARLEEAAIFPWSDPLDAVHEENRFERGVNLLGDEGQALWWRFDREMERLYATLSPAREADDD